MIINQVIETPEGAVEIQANLSPEQVKFLIEVGLNLVLAKGAVPFIKEGDFGVEQIQSAVDTVQ